MATKAVAAKAEGGAVAHPFKLKKWNAVVKWRYDANDICAICRNNIQEDCIECLGNPESVMVASCKVAFGECGHAYHFHCIQKWLEKATGSGLCPIDGQEFIFAKFTDKNTASM